MPHHHAGHQHHHKAAPIEKRQGPQTVVQYVYETAAKTFDGPIGGYMTVNPPDSEPSPPPQQQQQPSQQQGSGDNSNQQQQNSEAVQSAASEAVEAIAPSSTPEQTPEESSPSPTPTPEPVQTSEAAVSSKAEVKTSSVAHSSKAPASKSQSHASKAESATSDIPTPTGDSAPALASSAASSSAPPVSSHSSGGLSSGGKAGLAIGLILLIGLVAGLAFFFYRRKQRRDSGEGYEKTDDEKSAFAAGLARQKSTSSTRTAATAPRLSLRPVTQFLPDLAARGKAANAVAGAGLHDSSIASAAAMARTHENEKSNPFGDHAASPQQHPNRISDKSAGLPIQNNTNENPFGNHAEAVPPTNAGDKSVVPSGDMPAPLRVRTPTPEGGASMAAAGVVAGAAAAAAASKDGHRENAPKPLNLSPNRSASPSSTSPTTSEFSQTPASPGAMANGPPPSNVHRVQLDFKPSMDDELSLRAGDLVRLLHEYDDGWALCIRLDRSQQGVAPRTCLSARPVKPRPRGPPRGPGPRGPPPPGMRGPGQQRPSSPASGRGSPGPYGPPNGRVPRPMGPGPHGQPRSMSPGPYGGGPQRLPQGPPPGTKRRSNSASEFRDRRQSPPGPSPMNPNMQRPTTPGSMTPTRKPVPGQAM